MLSTPVMVQTGYMERARCELVGEELVGIANVVGKPAPGGAADQAVEPVRPDTLVVKQGDGGSVPGVAPTGEDAVFALRLLGNAESITRNRYVRVMLVSSRGAFHVPSQQITIFFAIHQDLVPGFGSVRTQTALRSRSCCGCRASPCACSSHFLSGHQPLI